MIPRTQHRFSDLFDSFSKLASVFSVFLGCVALAGWIAGFDPLRSLSPGMTRMKANAAIAFILSGAALWILGRKREPHDRLLHAARLMALLVTLLGLVTLFEHVFDWNTGIDELFVRDPEGWYGPLPPGRPVLLAAANFTLVGFALLFLSVPRGEWPVSFLCVVTAAISLLALMGYAYAREVSAYSAKHIPMATYVAVTFLVLSSGILFALHDRGLMALLSSDLAGGVTMRRLLAVVVVVPMLLGWVRVLSDRAGILTDEYGVALMVTAIMLVVLGFIWWNSASLDRIDGERQRIDGALRESTELLEKIFSNIHLNVAVLDPDFHFLRVNQAYADACGHPPGFFPGKNHFELYPHEENEAIFRKVVETGQPFHILAKPFVFPDHPEWGVTYWDWSLLPLMEAEGKVAGLIFCLVDVTERSKAEKELRESEERFRLLVESSPMGIFIVQNGRIVYQNPEQKRQFDLVGKDFEVRAFGEIHPEDAEKFADLCAAVTGGVEGKAPDMDLRFYPAGISEEGLAIKWVHVSTCPIEYGGRKAFLVNMADITRIREMEHMAKVREKLASLGQVAAGIAHEIRNPLSGINIYHSSLEKILDETFQDDEGRGQARRILGQIRTASDRIESVIRKVMEFSRPGPPKIGLNDINRAVEEAIDITAATVRKGGVRMDLSDLHPLPLCRTDPRMISQVLTNLITNATEAMFNREGPKVIGVRTAVESDRIVISVDDSGPGVPRALREKIFDPFFTTRKDGYGIGLSFSRQVVMDHGGTMKVGTGPLGGAEFRIEIPFQKEETSA